MFESNYFSGGGGGGGEKKNDPLSLPPPPGVRQKTAWQVGPKISTKETKHLCMKGRTEAAIMLDGEVMEDIEDFTYLGSLD